MNNKGFRQDILKLPNGNTVIHIVRDVGKETILYATVYSFELADQLINYFITKE